MTRELYPDPETDPRGPSYEDLSRAQDAEDVAYANRQADVYELERQLRRAHEALQWYGEMAKLMQRAALGVDQQVSLHVLKELALDGGGRVRRAVAMGAEP
jgi:hypothetical protein